MVNNDRNEYRRYKGSAFIVSLASAGAGPDGALQARLSDGLYVSEGPRTVVFRVERQGAELTW